MKYGRIEESTHRELEKLTYRELEAEGKKIKIRIYPILYKGDETIFSHNGLGVLTECTSCIFTEEVNGTSFLELEYITNDKKRLHTSLIEGNIIKAPTGDIRKTQLFRIVKVSKTFDRVKVYAQHIFFTDLGNGFIKDIYIKDKNRVEALQYILENTLDTHSFLGEGDITEDVQNLRIVRRSPVSAILGDEDNSLINRYSGEIHLNNFKISVKDTIGESNNVLVSYKKNITGVELTTDITDLTTRVIPIGSNGLLLPEYFIDSSKISDYPIVYNKEISFSNIGEKEANSDTGEGAVTKEEAYKLLRKAVANLYSVDKIDIPKFDLKVSMLDVTKTVEYENYKNLELVGLGDTVVVRHSLINISLVGRVYLRKYDCLTDMNTEINLGFKPESLAKMLNKTSTEVSNLANSVTETIDKVSATEGDIQGLHANVDTVSTNLQLARADISELQQTNSSMESDIVNLSSLVNNNSNKLGDLSQLTTTTKDNLVEAINEVKTLIPKATTGELIEMLNSIDFQNNDYPNDFVAIVKNEGKPFLTTKLSDKWYKVALEEVVI